jgi:hypothetical protein
MDENIITNQPAGSFTPRRRSVSFMAVILAIILAIILIMFGERLIFDINQWANPVIEQVSSGGMSPRIALSSRAYSSESMALSSAKVYYPMDQRGDYLFYKIVLHASFIIPIFLIIFLLYYLVYLKHQDSPYRVLVGGYIAFAIWMLLHLLIELGGFLLDKYQSGVLYLLLLILIVIISLLIFVIQKKKSKTVV